MSNGEGSGTDEKNAGNDKTAEAEEIEKFINQYKLEMARGFYNIIKAQAKMVKAHPKLTDYDVSIFDDPLFENMVIRELGNKLNQVYGIAHGKGRYDEVSSLPERFSKAFSAILT